MQMFDTCADCSTTSDTLYMWKDRAALGCAEELLLCRGCKDKREPRAKMEVRACGCLGPSPTYAEIREHLGRVLGVSRVQNDVAELRCDVEDVRRMLDGWCLRCIRSGQAGPVEVAA